MPTNPIQQVVIIIKENHSFDNYFGRFPGAEGQATLSHSPNPPLLDPPHDHPAWLQREKHSVRQQFTQSDIPAYYDYAHKFTLCDHYFTDVAGPSTPNHLMLICAASPIIANPPHYRVPPGQPLFDLPSLPAQLEKAGLSWGNYGGYAFDFIKGLQGKSLPSSQFVSDASAGKLPTVAWVYAEHPLSEHPADNAQDRSQGVGNITQGMQWTVAQVRAIVKGGLWPHCAIFITWDDWGGWYDHVVPPLVEKWSDGSQFRYGSRVGCLVLSPYAKPGYISKVRHSHVSLVRFCELTFGLVPVNVRSAGADGMQDCFDFSQKPLPPPL